MPLHSCTFWFSWSIGSALTSFTNVDDLVLFVEPLVDSGVSVVSLLGFYCFSVLFVVGLFPGLHCFLIFQVVDFLVGSVVDSFGFGVFVRHQIRYSGKSSSRMFRAYAMSARRAIGFPSSRPSTSWLHDRHSSALARPDRWLWSTASLRLRGIFPHIAHRPSCSVSIRA